MWPGARNASVRIDILHPFPALFSRAAAISRSKQRAVHHCPMGTLARPPTAPRPRSRAARVHRRFAIAGALSALLLCRYAAGTAGTDDDWFDTTDDFIEDDGEEDGEDDDEDDEDDEDYDGTAKVEELDSEEDQEDEVSFAPASSLLAGQNQKKLEEEFLAKYCGSDDEKRDLVDNYNKCAGTVGARPRCTGGWAGDIYMHTVCPAPPCPRANAATREPAAITNQLLAWCPQETGRWCSSSRSAAPRRT